MAAKTITQLVRIENLPAYLAAHGLRVVRAGWRWGDKRPWLILGPAQPAEEPVEEKGEKDDEND
jgi:hypothetical protein